jgi:hypothetical protein
LTNLSGQWEKQVYEFIYFYSLKFFFKYLILKSILDILKLFFFMYFEELTEFRIINLSNYLIAKCHKIKFKRLIGAFNNDDEHSDFPIEQRAWAHVDTGRIFGRLLHAKFINAKKHILIIFCRIF